MTKQTKREDRVGGLAGEGMPLSDVQRTAIGNTTRRGHGIDTAAPRYGDAAPITLHQGEVSQAELRRHLADGDDAEARKDTQ
jgi:hypothetical protein